MAGISCVIDGCAEAPRSRGMCKKHYLRWWKHGDPHTLKRAENGAGMQFILDQALNPPHDNCVLWPFSKDEHGRGTIWVDGKRWHAPRLVCTLAHGEAPPTQPETAHSCGKGHLGCVSAKHLRWANRSENLMDRVEHGTHNRGERHPESKLNRDKILAIRALRGKLTQREIAKQFGISAGHVSEIQTGKTWGWL